MSQDSVLKFLEKHKGKWFTTKEIADSIGLSSSNILRTLLTLYRFREVERKIGVTYKYYSWRAL